MTSFENKTIDELDIANPLSGSETLPLWQFGDTRKLAIDILIQYILSEVDTGDITEGSNLFYTDARADSRVAIHANNHSNPHVVTLDQLGIPDVTNLKHNWNGLANPAAGNDFSQGYTVGSLWLRKDIPRIWICIDSTVSSAVWQLIAMSKSDIGLSAVENTALSTWAGTTNIVNVANSAVTSKVALIDHNQLLNFIANKHIDHTSVTVNTPASGGLTGGSNIAASLTLGLNFSGMTLVPVVDSTNDKVAVWDASGGVIGYASPSQIAATGSFNNTVIANGTIPVTSTSRGTIFELNNNSTLNFDSVASLGAGFFISLKAISSSIVVLNADTGDNIDGQITVKVGAGNGCLVFGDGVHGLYTIGLKPDLIYVKDIKAQNTAGGTFTSGAWQKRDIAEIQDFANLLSITTNVLQLQPGTYEVDIECPANMVDFHQARLQNTTDNTTLIEGSVRNSAAAGTGGNNCSRIQGTFSISVTKNIEIQHKCTTTRSTDGFGLAGNLTNEIYTQGLIKRVGGILI